MYIDEKACSLLRFNKVHNYQQNILQQFFNRGGNAIMLNQIQLGVCIGYNSDIQLIKI